MNFRFIVKKIRVLNSSGKFGINIVFAKNTIFIATSMTIQSQKYLFSKSCGKHFAKTTKLFWVRNG
jgi:hypothetical protein